MEIDMARLGQVLAKSGAPLLKGLVENAIGGVGGKLAGAAIDALAEQLGVSPTPDKIVEAIEANPTTAPIVVRNVEAQMVTTMNIGVGDLQEYRNLLLTDAKSEGILSRLWRPLFAVVFTFIYAIVVLTICWLMWTRQLGTLTQLGEITGFLSFAFVAGCALLGVDIWKKTEEKKAGV